MHGGVGRLSGHVYVYVSVVSVVFVTLFCWALVVAFVPCLMYIVCRFCFLLCLSNPASSLPFPLCFWDCGGLRARLLGSTGDVAGVGIGGDNVSV